MVLKVSKPYTPSRRAYVAESRDDLYKGRPYKPLTESIERSHGRNNHGHITSRHRSAGHKKLYREIDFGRVVRDVQGKIERIEYDPNRSARIALVDYGNDKKHYMLAPSGLSEGDVIMASKNRLDPFPGNAMPLRHIPVGVQIHNIELKIDKGGQIARAAGTFCTLMAKDSVNATIRMVSGETRLVNLDCFATIGVLGNAGHKNEQLGKAGRSRWLGRRPSVRGVAMNPVDHPHGGGEGKTSGGRHPVSPWGKPTKGKKTRHNKRTDGMIVRDRRKG
jgi:large subunit ribosomal protein L2